MARSSSGERAFLRKPSACSSPPLPRQKDALSSPNESFLQSERAAVSLLPILATTIPEFTVHETERDAELYSSLFVDLQQVSPVAIKNRKNGASWNQQGTTRLVGRIKTRISRLSYRQYRRRTANSWIHRQEASRPPRRCGVILCCSFGNASPELQTPSMQSSTTLKSAKSSLRPLQQITGTMEEWLGSGIGGEVEDVGVNDPARQAPPASIAEDEILLGREANAEQIQMMLEHNWSRRSAPSPNALAATQAHHCSTEPLDWSFNGKPITPLP